MMSTFSGNSFVRVSRRRCAVANCAAGGDKKMPSGFEGCFIVGFSGPFIATRM